MAVMIAASRPAAIPAASLSRSPTGRARCVCRAP